MKVSPAPSHQSNASNSKPLTLDAFADFDDFALDKPAVTRVSDTTLTATSSSSMSTATTTSSITTITTSTSNNNAHADKLNDSFFNAFNDSFNDNMDPINTKAKVSNLGREQLNNNKLSAFDAFAVSSGGGGATATQAATASKDAKLFDAFNDNFDDSFGSSKPANSTILDNNFAKFDAFDVHNFSSDFGTAFNDSKHNGNNSSASSKASGKESHGKRTDKFSADYSKPESYDADLEEAIKRSMHDN